MPESVAAVHLDAVPAGPHRGPGIAELRPVRRHLGIEAFDANARVAREAGEVLVMAHDERAGGPYGTNGHEELYDVLRGQALFTVDGARSTRLPARSGSSVVPPPCAPRWRAGRAPRCSAWGRRAARVSRGGVGTRD